MKGAGITARALVLALPLLLLSGCVMPAEQAQATRLERPPSGPEAQISYGAHTAFHGSPRQAKLAPGGGFFLTHEQGEDAIPVIRLWRVGGEQAHAVTAWRLPRHKGFDLARQAAVSPDGRYVALSVRPSDRYDEVLTLYRVGREGNSEVDGEALGVTLAASPNSCGMSFLDSDRLLVCRWGFHKEQTGALALLTGFAADTPRVAPEGIRRGTRNDGGLVEHLQVSDDGLIGAVSTMIECCDGRMQFVATTFDIVDGRIVGRLYSPWAMGGAPLEAVVPLPPRGDLAMAAGGTTLETWALARNAALVTLENSSGKLPKAVGADIPVMLARDGAAYFLGKSRTIRITRPDGGHLDSTLLSGGRAILAVHGHEIRRIGVTDQRLKAARAYDEGLTMVRAGFARQGFGKIRQSVDLDPLLWAGAVSPDADHLARQVSNGTVKADLAEMGRTLLHLVEALRHPVAGGALAVSIHDLGGEIRVAGLDHCHEPDAHPLETAGVRPGDRIVSVAGRTVTNRAQWDEVMAGLHPGDTIPVVTAGPGNSPVTTDVKVVPSRADFRLSQAALDLTAYGILAVQAGHPEIALAAEARLRRMIAANEVCLSVGTLANVLGGLARVVGEGADAGYDYMLDQGGITTGAHRGNLGDRYVLMFPKATAPLYRDRAKLSFLLDRDEADLPVPHQDDFTRQRPYPGLDGRVID